MAMAVDRVYVASGYGLKLYGNRGHLVVHDGIGCQRRTARFNRATSQLRRLVVLGHTGYVTLDALRWLRDIGAAFVQIDRDGVGLGLDTVVLDDVVKAVDAVGKGGEFGAHPALRVVHQIFAGLTEYRLAVFVHDLRNAADAQIDAADHGTQIAVVLSRCAAIGEEQFPDFLQRRVRPSGS